MLCNTVAAKSGNKIVFTDYGEQSIPMRYRLTQIEKKTGKTLTSGEIYVIFSGYFGKSVYQPYTILKLFPNGINVDYPPSVLMYFYGYGLLYEEDIDNIDTYFSNTRGLKDRNFAIHMTDLHTAVYSQDNINKINELFLKQDIRNEEVHLELCERLIYYSNMYLDYKNLILQNTILNALELANNIFNFKGIDNIPNYIGVINIINRDLLRDFYSKSILDTGLEKEINIFFNNLTLTKCKNKKKKIKRKTNMIVDAKTQKLSNLSINNSIIANPSCKRLKVQSQVCPIYITKNSPKSAKESLQEPNAGSKPEPAYFHGRSARRKTDKPIENPGTAPSFILSPTTICDNYKDSYDISLYNIKSVYISDNLISSPRNINIKKRQNVISTIKHPYLDDLRELSLTNAKLIIYDMNHVNNLYVKSVNVKNILMNKLCNNDIGSLICHNKICKKIYIFCL